VSDSRGTRRDDALIEPLFGGLLHEAHAAGREPAAAPPRRRSARAWIASLLILLAGALAFLLLR